MNALSPPLCLSTGSAHLTPPAHHLSLAMASTSWCQAELGYTHVLDVRRAPRHNLVARALRVVVVDLLAHAGRVEWVGGCLADRPGAVCLWVFVVSTDLACMWHALTHVIMQHTQSLALA